MVPWPRLVYLRVGHAWPRWRQKKKTHSPSDPCRPYHYPRARAPNHHENGIPKGSVNAQFVRECVFVRARRARRSDKRPLLMRAVSL